MQPNDLPPPANRISCPECGNDEDFYEVAENVTITTRYSQNNDGSFTPEEDNSQVLGEIKLICGQCQKDLSFFHQRFSEMLF
ncbi:MAG: hypothetical protein ABFR63_09090 [Thermodesulfobacteriota bacterium]